MKKGIIVEGKVVKKLPNCMFRVELFTDGKNIVLGYMSGKMRKNDIKVDLGDEVKVELSPYDLSKGRIIRRN